MSRVLIVACDGAGLPRRILRDLVKLPHKYEGRFILANGSPRAFFAYAWNKSDAQADIDLQFAAAVTDEQRRGARSYGVERAK